MKIALITDGITPFVTGGMQKHSFYLAKYLTLNNCEVTLYHCVNSDYLPSSKEVNQSIFNGEYNLKNIRTFFFPKSIWFPGHYIFNSYRYSKIVYNSFKDEIHEFDFIYIKGLSGWKFLKNKMKFSKIAPIGVNFHGMNMFLPTSGSKLKFSNIIFKYIVKKNMISSDFVFSYGANVSLTILNAGVDSNKIIEIPTGIEKEWIISEDIISVNKKLRFLFIGRNDPLKGINNIFKAISNIKSDLFEFVFIGPIDEKLINNNIKYYGLIKDIEHIKNIIDSCDVLVSPSFSEGMPNVILEAMSRGLIILATNVGANSLLVSNSNGLIIKSPAPENILNSIEYILDQESENLKKMKLNSIKKIKTSFTWDVIAQNSKDEILNILSK